MQLIRLNMQLIKKVLSWGFAVISLQYLVFSAQNLWFIIHQQVPLPLFRRLLVATSFYVVVIAICGLAWWSIWKGKRSAKSWAIAASLMNILLFLRYLIFPSRPVWNHHVGLLFIGIVGLVAFLWPDK